MSKNPVREVRKLLRQKFKCFRQSNIHVGKSGPNRKYARIIIYYDYDEKRLEAVNKIEDLFYPYLNTAITRMNRNSTLCNLEITFPTDMISSICGMILLKL